MDPDARDSLLAAEARLRHAVLAADVAALDELLRDDVTFTGPDGRVLSKRDDLDAYAGGTLAVTRFDVVDMDARVIDGTGLTVLTAEMAGTLSGEPFDATLRYTRTWVREAGRWRVAAAHAGVA